MVPEESGYAANVEKAEIGERSWSFDDTPGGDLVKHHTPRMPGIELVAAHLGTTAKGMLKSIVMRTLEDKPRWVIGVVRGDHDVNEGKIRDALGCGVEMAPEAEARAAGFAIGYVSPAMGRLENTTVLIDPDACSGLWATGADEQDHHVTGWDWRRDSGLVDDALVSAV